MASGQARVAAGKVSRERKRDGLVRPILSAQSIPHFCRIFPLREWFNPSLLQPNECILGMVPSNTRFGLEPNTRLACPRLFCRVDLQHVCVFLPKCQTT
jgi:hypothetical protein